MIDLTSIYNYVKTLYSDGNEHPYRVAEYAESTREMIVALLHDAVEDELISWNTLADWLQIEKSEEGFACYNAIHILTRNKAKETYSEYIYKITDSGNRLAINVKIYDLFDHLHPHRVENIGGTHRTRYTKALETLVQSL